MPGIVWISSYPKSGNTWTRIFLANLILNENEPITPDRVAEVCMSEASKSWTAPLLKDGQSFDDLSFLDIAKLRIEAQKRAVKINKNVVLLKTHNYLGEFAGLPLCNMSATAAAIYIVRDPRDVAVSGADHFGVSLDETIELMNKPSAMSEPDESQIYEVYSSWSKHVKSWTQSKHNRLIVLRYEDMLADPHKVLGDLARKLGVTKDEERIKRAVEFSSFKQLQALEAEKGFVERSHKSEKFFRSGKAGGWREVLTDKQRYRIEKDHKAQMTRFGYL